MKDPITKTVTLKTAMDFVGVNSRNVKKRLGQFRRGAARWLRSTKAPAKLRTGLETLVSAVSDIEISLEDLTYLVAAGLYIIWPQDLVPDYFPVVGWLDDLGVLGLASAAAAKHWAKHALLVAKSNQL